MSTLITIIVTFFAGMGAGLGTGFAGLSAAAVISPMPVSYTHLKKTTVILSELKAKELDTELYGVLTEILTA